MKDKFLGIFSIVLLISVLFSGCSQETNNSVDNSFDNTAASNISEELSSISENDKISDDLEEDFTEKMKQILRTAKNRIKANQNAKQIEKLLNNVHLSPMQTNCDKLDKKTDEILNKIIRGDMTNYEMVKACYVYLIGYTKYGLRADDEKYKKMMADYQYYNGNDKLVVDSAYSAFIYRRGTCVEYSSAFVAMMKRLGFNASLVQGKIISKNGGYTYHVWARIKIEGKSYIFDPQVEDENLASDGSITFTYFGITYDTYSYLYTDAENMELGNFIVKQT